MWKTFKNDSTFYPVGFSGELLADFVKMPQNEPHKVESVRIFANF